MEQELQKFIEPFLRFIAYEKESIFANVYSYKIGKLKNYTAFVHDFEQTNELMSSSKFYFHINIE